MSHNVLIKNVKIVSITALRRAITELSNEGIQVSFEETNTFRTYRGQSNKCDYCVRLPGQPYDVGLVKQSDGSYLPYLDASMFPRNGVGLSCAWQQGDGYQDYERSAIGKLLQRYGTCVAEDSLAMAGHAFERAVDAAGNIIVTAHAF